MASESWELNGNQVRVFFTVDQEFCSIIWTPNLLLINPAHLLLQFTHPARRWRPGFTIFLTICSRQCGVFWLPVGGQWKFLIMPSISLRRLDGRFIFCWMQSIVLDCLYSSRGTPPCLSPPPRRPYTQPWGGLFHFVQELFLTRLTFEWFSWKTQ